jgi:hypothetical protein
MFVTFCSLISFLSPVIVGPDAFPPLPSRALEVGKAPPPKRVDLVNDEPELSALMLDDNRYIILGEKGNSFTCQRWAIS